VLSIGYGQATLNSVNDVNSLVNRYDGNVSVGLAALLRLYAYVIHAPLFCNTHFCYRSVFMHESIGVK
jgi:hypothetical protein